MRCNIICSSRKKIHGFSNCTSPTRHTNSVQQQGISKLPQNSRLYGEIRVNSVKQLRIYEYSYKQTFENVLAWVVNTFIGHKHDHYDRGSDNTYGKGRRSREVRLNKMALNSSHSNVIYQSQDEYFHASRSFEIFN